MAIEMVRVPSETPNITNIDDFAGLRYAYGNQNGYVIGKGQECSYSVNGVNFKINSGRLVLQGVECDIDANGVDVVIDNVSTLRYYSVYLQVNLALNETKILAQYDTAGYQNINTGDDLTANTTGTARLELYRFTANGGVIGNVERTVAKIEYSGTALSDYDNSKGTIEERLDKLGFKEGSIEFASGYTAVTNKLKRQGNYVIGQLIFNPDAYKLTYTLTSVNVYTTSNQFLIGKVPIEFRPKNGQNCGIDCWIEFPGFSLSSSNIILKTGAYATITSDGFVYMYLYGYKNFNTNITVRVDNSRSCRINFGYEAKPL